VDLNCSEKIDKQYLLPQHRLASHNGAFGVVMIAEAVARGI
jgi:hypothetical protein